MSAKLEPPQSSRGMPELDSGVGQLEFRSTQFWLVTKGRYLTTLCLSFLISNTGGYWCQEVQVGSDRSSPGRPSVFNPDGASGGRGRLGKSDKPGKPRSLTPHGKGSSEPGPQTCQ